jgi:hypothetical protein
MFKIIKDKTMPKIKETKGKKEVALSKTKVAISLGRHRQVNGNKGIIQPLPLNFRQQLSLA